MNMFSTRLFSEQELEENGIIQQHGKNTIMGEIHEAHHTLPHSFPTRMLTTNDPSYDDLIDMKPSKILETTYSKLQPPPSFPLPHYSKPHFHHQPSSRILSFENATQNVMDYELSPTYQNSIFSPKVEAEVPPNWMNGKRTKRAQPLYKSQSNAQDHIISERKRREKLTQRFVALSAVMDKASVLGDAQKHIKYLQEKVGEFEEQKRERRLESMVLVKKSKLILDDNNQSSSSSCCEDDSSTLDLPEIEVKFSDKDVLIKILCEKQKGHVAKIMAEVEKWNFSSVLFLNLRHFSITNSSVLPFGPSLDITI
uniref:BHLH domain-containing protein n=1 Tax=Brassica oleracea TaxID=3712 RepID=A0A679KKT6_BRAOL|nr:Unknown [Brassica oleracea]CAA8391820.1 Unknown [Brassica oleracea]CAA8403418.1 Unknown [Brassica oleracea]